jgi:sodium transport system ATP-binding protein
MVEVVDLRKDFREVKKPAGLGSSFGSAPPASKGVVHAVDGISFSAKPGEVFGLIGDNGAGKTTTLRMLSTVISPTGGKASVAGFDVVGQPEQVRAHIGFISGTTGLYGRLSPKEILMYFGGLYGLEGATLKSRVERLIEELEIKDFADRPCDKLSTGQKQRVGIARTVLHDPPVLFLDEPTSGLDVRASQGMMEFIERSRDSGKTVIFSSHIMSEVERLCDRLVVMHEGRIVGEGTVESLKAKTGKQTFEQTFLALVGFYDEAQKVSA